MDEYPEVAILMTTYKRTDTAVRTIAGIRNHLDYPNVSWFVSDDGSEQSHLTALAQALKGCRARWYNSNRRGVGHGMNTCLAKIFQETPFVMILEDDWELRQDLDLRPYVRLLAANEDVGMIRMGLMSPGLSAELVHYEGQLWWKFNRNGYQYIFTGHAALRHRRFFERVGYYEEGATPGQTEVDMCYKYTVAPEAPAILWPAHFGDFGPFAHIGAESLGNVEPEAQG